MACGPQRRLDEMQVALASGNHVLDMTNAMNIHTEEFIELQVSHAASGAQSAPTYSRRLFPLFTC